MLQKELFTVAYTRILVFWVGNPPELIRSLQNLGFKNRLRKLRKSSIWVEEISGSQLNTINLVAQYNRLKHFNCKFSLVFFYISFQIFVKFFINFLKVWLKFVIKFLKFSDKFLLKFLLLCFNISTIFKIFTTFL